MKRIRLIVMSKMHLVILFCIVLMTTIVALNLGSHAGFLKTLGNSIRGMDNRSGGRVAIVIDDFGFNGGGTKEMLALNIPITCAVLPFSEYTKTDSEMIMSKGHEIIIHLPMEPHHGDPKWLGEKGIRGGLTTEKIEEIVREAVEENPYAVGVNNHMGSKATEDRRIIETIIKILKEKNMFILDSKTTMHSVVKEVALSYEVPYIERSVFLDNVKDKAYIKKQIKQLGEAALLNGDAVAIGHVGPEGGVVTAEAIKEMIPELEAMGIQFVYLSQLVKAY